MNEYLSFLLIYYSVYLANAVLILTLKKLVLKGWAPSEEFLLIVISFLISELFSQLFFIHPLLLIANISVNILALLIAKKIIKNYTFSGMNFYLANYFIFFVGIIWSIQYLLALPLSNITKVLMMSAAPLLIITLPSGIVQLLEHYDALCRQNWLRPRLPLPERSKKHSPMVSLHVPTHSEPPEMVIETLNKLAQMDYHNFEVLVIDNNTKDPHFWMPVKKHCEFLGKKFRFFHIENLGGAKAGALNFALKQTDPRASIMGVIDADYHAGAAFLKALIGYFDDPKMGFVQTPHDYRGWENNLYLTMCYWEYKLFFHTTLVSMNERDAALTVGTMCLIRKKALKEAGGWSTWCVTEDSELAIRIHDLGYTSVYVPKTFGRGLIPETFDGYKRQQYRWTAGPVQELQHHFKHLLGLSKRPSQFTFGQRAHHFNHGLDRVIVGLSIPLMFISLSVIASMVTHREVVPVPFELWLAATVLLVSNGLLTYLSYKVIAKPTFWQIIGAIFAAKALAPTITYAALKTFLTGKAKWHRTNKFKTKNSFAQAFLSTKDELFIGLLLVVSIIWAFLMVPYTGLLLMLLIGLSYIAMSYLAAPIMALINVYSMREAKRAAFGFRYLALD